MSDLVIGVVVVAFGLWLCVSGEISRRERSQHSRRRMVADPDLCTYCGAGGCVAGTVVHGSLCIYRKP